MNTTTREPTREEVLIELGEPAPRGIRRLRNAAFVALGLALIAAGVAWRVYFAAPQPLKFVTTPLRKGDLSSTVTATGTLRGRGTVTVGAEASGRVSAVHVDFNDTVQAGQLLAEVDPAITKAALAQSEAQLTAARANVKMAEASARESKLAAERTRGLTSDGLASKQALESALAAADRNIAQAESARAQVIVAEATVESNRTALVKTQVRSPVDGVVLSRSIEVGQTLAATMTTPELFKVARDLSDMELTIAIDETDVGRTTTGQEATFKVDAWPDRTFHGVLKAIHNTATTKDNVVTYEAVLAVDNTELLLRPGMTATTTIATAKRSQVMLVPSAALRFTPPVTDQRNLFDATDEEENFVEASGSRVWILRNGEPTVLHVSAGLSDGVSTEVSGEGLSEGQLVITDAQENAT